MHKKDAAKQPDNMDTANDCNVENETLRFQPYFSSARFDYFPPIEKFDKDCHELFCDDRVMLPFIPQLYNMEWSAFLSRRKNQRQSALKTSCFVDIVERKTGKFVGVTGFREIRSEESNNKPTDDPTSNICTSPRMASPMTAEYLIGISFEFQMKGICTEAFFEMLRFAKERLNCTMVKGVTPTEHATMCKFFAKYGLVCVRNMFVDGAEKWGTRERLEFSVFIGNINHILLQFNK